METMKKGMFIAVVVILAVGAYASRAQPSVTNAWQLFKDGLVGVYHSTYESFGAGNTLLVVFAIPFLFLLWKLAKIVLFPQK